MANDEGTFIYAIFLAGVAVPIQVASSEDLVKQYDEQTKEMLKSGKWRSIYLKDGDDTVGIFAPSAILAIAKGAAVPGEKK